MASAKAGAITAFGVPHPHSCPGTRTRGMTDFRRDSMVRPQHREASHRTMNDAKTPPMSNESAGNFFEDFKLGQEIVHATPRTVTVGDVSLFTALYGSRFAVQSSDAFAQSIGYPTAPIDDMLTFHIVLGKTVPDISRNAIANLGYADMRFLKAVYPGDTLSTTTEIIGLKENSNRKNGTVYVRSTGRNQTWRAGALLLPLGDGEQAR